MLDSGVIFTHRLLESNGCSYINNRTLDDQSYIYNNLIIKFDCDLKEPQVGRKLKRMSFTN